MLGQDEEVVTNPGRGAGAEGGGLAAAAHGGAGRGRCLGRGPAAWSRPAPPRSGGRRRRLRSPRPEGPDPGPEGPAARLPPACRPEVPDGGGGCVAAASGGRRRTAAVPTEVSARGGRAADRLFPSRARRERGHLRGDRALPALRQQRQGGRGSQRAPSPPAGTQLLARAGVPAQIPCFWILRVACS